MGRPSDRDPSYMRLAHGTTRLITDYGVCPDSGAKPDFARLSAQNWANPSEIRNADDYDDWEYGTEPIPHDHTWTRKRST